LLLCSSVLCSLLSLCSTEDWRLDSLSIKISAFSKTEPRNGFE
jgi:hypothetical protein